MPTCSIVELIDECGGRARSSGALQPIRTRLGWVRDRGLNFPVRWVSTLADKQRAGLVGPRRATRANPFQPWDPDLEVGAAGPDHVILLNKFPVMPRHALIISREFEPQSAPLTSGNFAAVVTLLREAGGLCFYNGGAIAGASQSHRHLQWIPDDDRKLLPLLSLYDRAARTPPAPTLDFVRAQEPIVAAAWDAGRPEEMLSAHYAALCQRLGLAAIEGAMPPYNLLLTRDWMLLVPRRQEHWQHISINALGFAGSLFVRDPAQLSVIRAAGPLTMLGAVAGR